MHNGSEKMELEVATAVAVNSARAMLAYQNLDLLLVDTPASGEFGPEYERSDKVTVHGMHDCLKSIVGTKLLVDVVEMVAERL